MSYQWHNTDYPGVRFRYHPSRKHGAIPDRYFAIRYQIDGKRREEGLGWASQGWSPKKASDQLESLKRAAKTGDGPTSLAETRRVAEYKRQQEEAERQRLQREQVTFSQFWTSTYLPHAEAEKSNRSLQREISLYNKWIAPVIGELAFKEISPIHLERIKSNMTRAGLAPRSAQYALAVVRQVFNHAIRLNVAEGSSPTSKVKVKLNDNRRQRFLSREEANSVLSALRDRSADLADMALLSLHCGLRAGEVFGLEWRDVNLETGTMTLRDTKNGRTRHAYMTSQVREMFANRGGGAASELVFPDTKGNRRASISNVFGAVVDALGLNDNVTDPLDKVVFHTLRHTYASWLVMKGTPLYTVQQLLGHRTSAMTERYSHLAPDHMRSAVQALERHAESVEVDDDEAEDNAG